MSNARNSTIKPSTLAIAVAVAVLSSAPAESGPLPTLAHSNLLTLAALVPTQEPVIGTCPDIGVTAEQIKADDGTIRVTFKVVNSSGTDFISHAGRQMLIITSGGSAASVPFSEIPSGEELVWQDTFYPHEFPSTYRASINFAPGIFNDNNPWNDDCSASNNQAALDVSVSH